MTSMLYTGGQQPLTLKERAFLTRFLQERQHRELQTLHAHTRVYVSLHNSIEWVVDHCSIRLCSYTIRA